jgi:hypothetical protein
MIFLVLMMWFLVSGVVALGLGFALHADHAVVDIRTERRTAA